MAAAQLDVGQLSTFCSVPEASITTLLDKPTAELVRSLLENVAARAQEFNGLKAEKLRVDVELESAVRGGDSKTRALKASVDRAQKQSSDLKQKLQLEEASKATVEQDLENLKSSTASSTSQITTLQTRVSSLESSNRDTVSLLDSKSTAYDNLAQELNSQHQKTVDLRKQVSELEQAVQASNATSSSSKFHEQGLEQEIEQLKRSNEWLEKELKTKSEEYTKFRKEKGLRISELQRHNEETNSDLESLRKTETMLRRRLDEIGEKMDQSLQRIQQLENESARKEESFRIELDAAARLQDLTKKSAETEHQRQQDLLSELETSKEDASEQLGKLGAELETEHQEREACETKIAELEVQIEQLEAELSGLKEHEEQPSTPRLGVNGGSLRTPIRGASPGLFSPGSSRSKGSLSMTQLYSEYNEVKRDLANQKRQNLNLSNTIDTMLQDLEQRGPEVQETEAERDRLYTEVQEMSSLTETLGQERDEAQKAVKRLEGQVKARATESDVLRQQLRDLSCQIKILLMEAHMHSQGQDEIDVEERARLERIARGQELKERAEGETATSRLISDNLVIFHNISELQEQNQNLVKITREVGEKMEQEEALRKQTEDARDWDALQQKYERCKDEIKSLATQSQSYIRERDMFRRMLAHRGQIPHGAESMFDESVNGDRPSVSRQDERLENGEDASSSKDAADYAKLLRDMQAHFDAYKQEAATDNKTLKTQVDGLSKESSDLRTEVARSKSQVALGGERYEMLQSNYSMLKNENLELQKRMQTNSDNAGRQDLRIQQAAEDLVEARGLLDSMRNETANLKAEKEFWKTIEKRITEDNHGLLNERNRLTALNTSLQSILNEREHAENETRRRLHAQIESLEKELHSTKQKLSEEVEENKRATLRREYEHEQNQKKLDDLISSLGSLREELVGAKTARDHLSSRVDELSIELRSAEERVAVLQATHTRPNQAPMQTETEASAGDATLSKEQQLGVHVSELRRDLDLTKAELENYKGQIEQYKAISQASEDELASLNQTQEIYRQETDKLIEEKDAKVKQLEQRIDDTAAELQSTTQELSALQNEQSENGRRLDEQKKVFEAELSYIRDQDERHAAAAEFYKEDLKMQADIAQQAQQNYENELVKHADAAKALQRIREEYNTVKMGVVEARTEAEVARAHLSQNDESWTVSRERFESEISELRSARQSLKEQNEHLHQQLEAFSVRRARPLPDGDAGSADLDSSPAIPGLDNMQEVIKYLRREKEIVDVQLELSSQEAKRLRQQLDYTQSQLEDSRLKINQQRSFEAGHERSVLDHNKLMETINDLNTLRESNVTLRAESRQAQATAVSRAAEIEQLKLQIEPLQAQIRELSDRCEIQVGEAKLLKENCDRWQQRAQNVLQKYDRVDPAELEALKEQLKTTESERDELVSSKQALQEQVDTVAAEIAQAEQRATERVETMRGKLTEQFKARSKQLSDRIKEKDTALQTASIERQGLEERIAGLADVQEQLDRVTAELNAAIERNTAVPAANDNDAQPSGDDGEIDESAATQTNGSALEDHLKRAEEAEAKVQLSVSELERLRIEDTASKATIAELESQLVEAKETIASLQKEIARLQGTQGEAADSANQQAEAQLQQLRDELTQAQENAESLRAAASITDGITKDLPEGEEKSVADQVAEHVEAVRAELEKRHRERTEESERKLKERSVKMAKDLTDKLKAGKAQIRQASQEENEKALSDAKIEHDREVEQLQAQHKLEMDELRQHEEAKNNQLKEAQQSKGDQGREPDTVKTETQKPSNVYQPTDEEIKEIITTSDLAKSVLRSNIARQVAKSKEEIVAQLKVEHEKDLAHQISELQAKADAAKEHALTLDRKKTSLQMNIQANKARVAQIKIDIVQKAAQETPQKSVQEVWAIAKDAKPPAVALVQPQSAAPKVPTPQNGVLGGPTPTAQAGSAKEPASQPIAAAPNESAKAGTFGQPSIVRPSGQMQTSIPQADQDQKPPADAENNSQAAAPIEGDPASAAPQTPAESAATQQPKPGPGLNALKPLSSGIPRGGSIRGSQARGNTRGRGSGIARGQPQAISTNSAQATGQGRGSPTSVSATGAKQFVPGNKRPREDGQNPGGDGKRLRGGAGGGGSAGGGGGGGGGDA